MVRIIFIISLITLIQLVTITPSSANNNSCTKLLQAFIKDSGNLKFKDNQTKILKQLLENKGIAEEDIPGLMNRLTRMTSEYGVKPKQLIGIFADIKAERCRTDVITGRKQLMDFIDFYSKKHGDKLSVNDIIRIINDNLIWMYLGKNYSKKGKKLFKEIADIPSGGIPGKLKLWIKNRKAMLKTKQAQQKLKLKAYDYTAREYMRLIEKPFSKYDSVEDMHHDTIEAILNFAAIEARFKPNEVISHFENNIFPNIDEESFQQLKKGTKKLKDFLSDEFERFSKFKDSAFLPKEFKKPIGTIGDVPKEIKHSLTDEMRKAGKKALDIQQKCSGKVDCLNSKMKNLKAKISLEFHLSAVKKRMSKLYPCLSRNKLVVADMFTGLSFFTAQTIWRYRDKWGTKDFPYENFVNSYLWFSIGSEAGCRGMFRSRQKFGEAVKLVPATRKENLKHFWKRYYPPLLVTSASVSSFLGVRYYLDRKLEREEPLTKEQILYDLPVYTLYSSVYGPMKSLLLVDRIKYITIPSITRMLTRNVVSEKIKSIATWLLLTGVDKGIIGWLNLMEWRFFDEIFIKKYHEFIERRKESEETEKVGSPLGQKVKISTIVDDEDAPFSIYGVDYGETFQNNTIQKIILEIEALNIESTQNELVLKRLSNEQYLD